MRPSCTCINLNLFYVKGNSDIVLKLEVIKRIISISILVAAIPLGVMAICISRVIYSQIALYINIYYTGKKFGYGYLKQWKDFGGFFIISFFSVLPAFVLTFSDLPNIFIIGLGVVLSIVIYTTILKIRNDVIFKEYIVEEIKKRFLNKK